MEEENMKKLIALMLSILMVCSLAACASKQDSASASTETASTEASGEEKTLTMATNVAFPPYEFYENEQPAGIDVDIATAICEKLGYSSEDKYRAFAKSTVFSADMAHASHPSYLSKAEPNLPVKLNKGPVLKMATGQSYATSPRGTAFFKTLCERADIPYQQFNNRSDARGGGTIGPIISYEYGLSVVDIGNPMLAMHSVREF